MAQVWIARLRGKHGFEKLVAIKTILPKLAADQHFQQMFLDEARIAAGIEHNNVAHIYDLGDEHAVLYIAMEWVDGDALTKIYRAVDKKGEKFAPGVLLRVLADTCGGLHAAHELRGKNGVPLGVVHRDVSPQNILVTSRGVAKLIDFGIAKARDRLSGDTNTGFLKGKVHYMAPEQALGSAIDRRADVWAIGAILYHYLAGEQLYEAPNQLATLHMLTSGKPPKPLPSTVPAVVKDVVMRALSHDREKRYATAAELQAALEEAMVSAKLTTTTADVAAFAELHVADRAAKRREAIELALAAAEERVRVQALFKPDPDGSSSIPNVSSKLKAHAAKESEGEGDSAGSPDSNRPPTLPAIPLRARDEVDPEVRLPLPPSVPSSATLERAVLETPVIPGTGLRKGIWVLAAVGVAGIGIGVLFTSVMGRGGPGGPSATPAAAPPPSVVASPVPSALVPPVDTSIPPPAASSVAALPSPPPPPASPARPGAPAQLQPARPPSSPQRPPSSKIPQVIPNGF